MKTAKRLGGLGFRDLHLFNQALLANQVWKILRRPHSPVFKLLKARYFRDGTFLHAHKGSQPSYGWNSLLFGAELLKRGAQVIIGNGKNTNIGTEQWLPTSPPRAPTLLPMVNPELKVAELINTDTRQWDEHQLLQCIVPADHHIITKIYLPDQSINDSVLWSLSRDGNYTVKSGYRLASTNTTDPDEPKPPLAAHPDIAKGIWLLNIALKLRHFLWRVLSRAVGTAENLRRRNIQANEFCTRCITERESANHVFFTCIHATAVWRGSGIPYTLLGDPYISIEEKIQFLLNTYNDSKVEKRIRYLPFWIMWRLWKSRNNMVYNHRAEDTSVTLEYAMDDTKEWLDSQDDIGLHLTSGPTRPDSNNRRWIKPRPGWVKCNFDASHHEGNRSSGLGWIIRDSNGNFLQGGMGQFQGRHSIEEAEATSLIWALQSTWSLGFRRVEFDGDNCNLIHLVNSNTINLRLQHYLREIQAWRAHFDLIKFTFHPRSQNSCADLLAKTCISYSQPWALYNYCPSFLTSFVNDDCNFAI